MSRYIKEAVSTKLQFKRVLIDEADIYIYSTVRNFINTIFRLLRVQIADAEKKEDI